MKVVVPRSLGSASDVTERDVRSEIKPLGLQPVRPPRVTSGKVIANIIMGIFGILFLAPLIWLILASVDAHAGPNMRWPDLSFKNFAAISSGPYISGLWNSLILSGIATVVATVPSIFAGYAFSRHHIPFKGPLLLSILVLAGVPVTILIVPIYEVFSTHNALTILPAAIFLGVTSLPFELWIIKNYIDAVPADLEESARLEKASTLQVLRRVVVPLALPGICAAAIFGFINSWGNFLVPLVLISNPNEAPSPVAMYGFFGGNVIRWGDIAAYAVWYALPVLLLYLFMARLFRGGFVLSGAIRG